MKLRICTLLVYIGLVINLTVTPLVFAAWVGKMSYLTVTLDLPASPQAQKISAAMQGYIAQQNALMRAKHQAKLKN